MMVKWYIGREIENGQNDKLQGVKENTEKRQENNQNRHIDRFTILLLLIKLKYGLHNTGVKLFDSFTIFTSDGTLLKILVIC